MQLEQFDGLAAIAGLRHDLQLRPCRCQSGFKNLPQERLIVSDQGSGAHGFSENSMVASTPCGVTSFSASVALPP